MPVHDLDSAVSDRSRSGERLAPDDDLGLELVRVTELAALAAGRWSGPGDEKRGSRAAVAAARLLLRSVPFQETVVISGNDVAHGGSILVEAPAGIRSTGHLSCSTASPESVRTGLAGHGEIRRRNFT